MVVGRPIAVLLLALALLAERTDAGFPHGTRPPRRPKAEFAAKEVLVLFEDSPRARSLMAALSVKSSGNRSITAASRAGIMVSSTLGKQTALVRIEDGSTPARKARELAKLPGVLTAEPNYWVYIQQGTGTINDANFTLQWGLRKVSADLVWPSFAGASMPIVCTTDTGIAVDHPDLKPNLHPSVGLDYYTATEGNPIDDNGHGTHVAGIIGAVGNNSIGVAGVTFLTQILACRSHNKFGRGDVAAIIHCINYCSEKGAKIMHASVGMVGSSAIMAHHVQGFCKTGALFVAAAGNSELDVDIKDFYPATIPADCVVAVAATKQDDGLASFSNRGKRIHLAAPGVSITSTWLLSSSNEPGVRTLDGTSMSAPFVSGAAALLMARSGLQLSGVEVKQLLMDTVDHVPGLEGKVASAGRLNVSRAFEAVEPGFIPSPSPSPLPGLSSMFVRFTGADLPGMNGTRVIMKTPSMLNTSSPICYHFDISRTSMNNRISSADIYVSCTSWACKEAVAEGTRVWMWDTPLNNTWNTYQTVVLNPVYWSTMCQTSSYCFMPEVEFNLAMDNKISAITICMKNVGPLDPGVVIEPVTFIPITVPRN